MNKNSPDSKSKEKENILTRNLIDNKYIIVLYLVFLVSLFLYQNYCYIKWDGASIFCDMQTFRSWKFFYVLKNHSHFGMLDMKYPPLVYLVSSAYYVILGYSPVVARMSLFIFSIIFILSMYGIGKEFGGRIGGICVSAIAASSPHIISFAHRYYIDFPQTAMTALAFYMLLLTKGYRDRKFSWILGVVLGLAVFTKWSTLFFILVPLVWFIIPYIFKNWKCPAVLGGTLALQAFVGWRLHSYYMSLQQADHWKVFWPRAYFVNLFLPVSAFLIGTVLLERKLEKDEKFPESGVGNILNFSRVATLPLIIVGPWLFWSARSIMNKFAGDVAWHRVFRDTLDYYIYAIKYQYSFSTILIFIGLVFIFVFRKDIYRKLVLPVGLIFSFFLMAKIGFPFMRYILSFLVFTAALGGYWVGYAGKLRKPVAVLIVTISIISLLGWFAVPGYSGIFQNVDFGVPEQVLAEKLTTFKILRTNPPVRNIFDASIAISCIETERNMDKEKPVFLLMDLRTPSSHFPVTGEDFWNEGILQKKRFLIFEFSRLEDLLRRQKEGINPRQRDLFVGDYIIVTEKSREKLESVLEGISRHYPGCERIVYEWERPGGIKMYLVQFRQD
ncbi:MAG: glycosyltransferase family 39 protein [Candidatus Eremiobacteraeota bacterium]|nr:glycosyltransferase family 39 protein [Candidatus Eremiobacteraeota bacterium]